MKILSVRQGFASDHSSTSYEFLAIDKSLGKEARSAVSNLSRRVNPTGRRAHFSYHVDGYDIPGGWQNLMAKYYDVMYREEYGWWTLAIAFNAAPGQYDALLPYEFSGTDDFGINMLINAQRIIIEIQCMVEADFAGPDYDEYDDEDEEGEEEDERGTFATDDELLNMLIQIRQQIIDGDYRALYAVWEEYGDDEDPPPEPENQKRGAEVIAKFKSMLSQME